MQKLREIYNFWNVDDKTDPYGRKKDAQSLSNKMDKYRVEVSPS